MAIVLGVDSWEATEYVLSTMSEGIRLPDVFVGRSQKLELTEGVIL